MFTDLAVLMNDVWAPRWKVQRATEKPEPKVRKIEPTITVDKDNDCTYVEMLVPGFDSASINVKASDSVLKISGERNNVRRKELHGVLEKEISLTPEIDVDAIQANYKDGVLTISLPKAKEKMREIKII